MIYSLTGKLLVKSGSTAVVECGGVGFSCGVDAPDAAGPARRGGDGDALYPSERA